MSLALSKFPSICESLIVVFFARKFQNIHSLSFQKSNRPVSRTMLRLCIYISVFLSNLIPKKNVWQLYFAINYLSNLQFFLNKCVKIIFKESKALCQEKKRIAKYFVVFEITNKNFNLNFSYKNLSTSEKVHN